uniref:Argininosuccinate lyase n=1 Tax=Candidatus Kentrum sp. MB TaxID=2138164 RepID=A0A450XBT0_9GAMM|nr:MAG: argininosuccinate lyase [Candidatus Kentron sp. MB]VFK26741.1 MAG: argininosuccinate lyase [Candidatus Kentron sp. MB]VFK74614.1 MAG: argininosuccinate lyase [Candidatus Kentron sp. MB]
MPEESQNKKPWSGRFTEATSALVEAFTASVTFDQRLYPFDILGSIAHATMLASVGVLSIDERDAIVDGLEGIGADIEAGALAWSDKWEDVHMNIEAELVRRIGESGKKLHTGRSRNDQVATDLRLYLREETDALLEELRDLQSVILDIAEREAETPMPGFTHLQVAQPIIFGHHMLAWFEMLARDRERLLDTRRRINRMPLGAAALAGTGFPIDRTMTADLLGFEDLCRNSLDAVSDRDFAIEFSATAALIMTHLSRMSEELILWSSTPFGFIELGDGFCTGSSIMPQKKNPDIPELVRGKTGRVNGNLLALLVLMKGQPLAYNRDNQEDKEALFDTVDTTKACVKIYTRMLVSMVLKRDRMRAQAKEGFSTATDLADYLVRKKGVPFRDAHEIVGKAVRYGLDKGKDLTAMTLAELQKFTSVITEDVFTAISLEGSIASRNHIGGTAQEQVRKAVIHARKHL